MTIWIDKLVNCLELETVDLDLLGDIDDILSWFVPSNNVSSYKSLEVQYGQQVLNERFEEFLDRLIVGDLAAGEMFPVSLSEEQAKRRYRQLIRIFHPDRGTKPVAWLNYRAEKINKAHRYYLDNLVNFEGLVSIDEPPVQSAVADRPNSKAKFKYKPNVWRDRLGSPKEFQRKALAALIVISLLLLLITFFDNSQQYGRALKQETEVTKGSLNVLGEEVEGDKVGESPVEIYTLNSKAQEILQEADLLIEQSNASAVGGENSDQKNSFDEFVYSVPGVISPEQEGMNYDGELNHLDDKIEGVHSCYDYDQTYKEIAQNKTVLRRLNLREGPSLECDVLETLVSGAHLKLLAQSEDGEWTQVTSENLKGWVDTELLMASPKLKPKKSVEVQASKQRLIKQRVTKEVNSKKTSSLVLPIEKKDLSGNTLVAPDYFSVIEKLKRHYEFGDGDAMAALYMTSGRENELRGADKIRKYYRKAFNRTTNRHFKYSIGSYQQDSESTAIVKGKMYLSLTPKKSTKVTSINANYKIVMVKVNGEYKIAAFEWTSI